MGRNAAELSLDAGERDSRKSEGASEGGGSVHRDDIATEQGKMCYRAAGNGLIPTPAMLSESCIKDEPNFPS